MSKNKLVFLILLVLTYCALLWYSKTSFEINDFLVVCLATGVPKEMDIRQLLEKYLISCKANNLTRETIRDKRRHLSYFVDGLLNSSISEDTVYEFLCNLNVSEVVNYKIRRDLRAFLKYLNENNLCDFSYLRIKLKRPSEKPSALITGLQFQTLDNKCHELMAREKRYVRWHAVLHFLWETGVRRGELVNIWMDNIDFDRKVFHFKAEKTGEIKEMYFFSDYEIYFKEYIELFGPKQKLFNITDKQVGKIIRTLCELSGLGKEISPHAFRRARITELLKNGAHLEDVSKIYHKKVQTTMGYYRTVQLEEVYRNHFKSPKSIESTLNVGRKKKLKLKLEIY